ncbi:hypothetical protein B0H14DRAFT_848101 [Mycena olivaceomarginata]|nr:hypothetical protein B0H14DRAFT_848101 [Mycena olivaceomarginata]
MVATFRAPIHTPSSKTASFCASRVRDLARPTDAVAAASSPAYPRARGRRHTRHAPAFFPAPTHDIIRCTYRPGPHPGVHRAQVRARAAQTQSQRQRRVRGLQLHVQAGNLPARTKRCATRARGQHQHPARGCTPALPRARGWRWLRQWGRGGGCRGTCPHTTRGLKAWCWVPGRHCTSPCAQRYMPRGREVSTSVRRTGVHRRGRAHVDGDGSGSGGGAGPGRTRGKGCQGTCPHTTRGPIAWCWVPGRHCTSPRAQRCMP